MTTKTTGADNQLVALYKDGSVRATTIDDLVEIAADYAQYEETADLGAPVRVYHLVDERLVEANVFVEYGTQVDQRGLRQISMQVLRIAPRTGTVASATTTF